MDNHYSCELIQDLIPGYLDEVLSEAGAKAVQEHLKECKNCKKVYEEMKMESKEEILPKEQIALDGFRKIRRHTKILKIIIGIFSGLFLTAVLCIFLKYYVIGFPAYPDGISISNIVYHEEDQSLTIEGELNYAGSRISRVVWEEGEYTKGELYMTVYMADTLPFYQGRKDFSVTIPNMEDYIVYLESPRTTQRELYNWHLDHIIQIQLLEEKIYDGIPELDKERDILTYREVAEADGKKGVFFSVLHLFGEDVWHQFYIDRLVMHGDIKTGDFEVWISLEEPYQILLYDIQTGEYTKDISVVLQYKEALQEKEYWD